MKKTVVGFEILAGKSNKTGKDYDMSRIHCLIPLEQNDRAKGSVGTSYDCPAHLLEKVRHLAPPFVVELEMEDVQRFGRREQQIMSLVPVERAKVAA